MQQINWFPGHMAKTKKQIMQDIKLVDVVIELLDARIPISSANPMLTEMLQSKKRLVILNKSDLADENENKKWIEYFAGKNIKAICVNSTANNKYTKRIYSDIIKLCEDKFIRNEKRGIKNTTVRAMVVGIPNVGKSTLVNSISNKAAAKTGNKPGVTTAKQWIRLNKDIELLDTPGILWPKFDDEKIGRHLAFIGSINDRIIDVADLAFYLIEWLKFAYPNVLFSRYNVDETHDTLEIMREIAVNRGCIQKGNEPNIEAASKLILDDFRKARLGRITVEKPEDYGE